MPADGGSRNRPPEDRLWGADRAILYLEAPVRALDDLDGSREQEFRAEARKFLDSPATTFDKHPAEYVGHIRELGSKTRGFATWCQNRRLDRELCVVHEIYRKENEAQYWSDLQAYDEAGHEFAVKFRDLDSNEYSEWTDSMRATPGVELVTSN